MYGGQEAVQDFGGLFGRDLSKEPLIIRPKSLVDDKIDERSPAPSTRKLYIYPIYLLVN